MVVLDTSWDHEEVTMSDDQSDGPVEWYLAAIEGAAIGGCDALSPKVTLDATVPHWRFSVRGDAAMRAELSRCTPTLGVSRSSNAPPCPLGSWSSSRFVGSRKASRMPSTRPTSSR